MSFFTHKQDIALKQILKAVIDNKKNPELASIIRQMGLIQAIDKDYYTASIIDDVEIIAENNDIVLNDEKKKRIAQYIMSKYDHSHYDNFVYDAILYESVHT